MNQDRIGLALMVIASAWMATLAFTEPGNTASTYARLIIGITAAIILLSAVFPRHLYLSGTVLMFTALGLSLHIGVLGIFGIGFPGLLSAVLVAIAMWLRRDRLDASGVVLVTSLVACGLAIVQPQVVLFALAVIAIVNLMIWLANAFGSRQTS